MKIVRWGTVNYCGEYEVNLETAVVDWDGKNLRVHSHRARDFAWKRNPQITEEPASKSKHDYRIEISLSEFAAQLRELGKAANSPSAGLVATSLRSSLCDLLSLALLCAQPTQE